MKKWIRLFGAAATLSMVSASAVAIDIEAGPIWNHADAQGKCPKVCTTLEWNGQWTTTVVGKMSVCGTTKGGDIPVGPIWNNADAQNKCPSQLARVKWNGNWLTTVPGRMSVCGCDAPAPVY